jgi:hypothetical protein
LYRWDGRWQRGVEAVKHLRIAEVEVGRFREEVLGIHVLAGVLL